MRQAISCIVALIALAATGISHANTLNLQELCGGFEILNDPDNRVYRGQSKYRGVTLDTALIMTPISNAGATVVFYAWGIQPKWNIDEPGCAPATSYWKKDAMTVYMARGKIRITYKFSDDETSAKYTYRRGDRLSKGAVTLSEM